MATLVGYTATSTGPAPTVSVNVNSVAAVPNEADAVSAVLIVAPSGSVIVTVPNVPVSPIWESPSVIIVRVVDPVANVAVRSFGMSYPVKLNVKSKVKSKVKSLVNANPDTNPA